MLTIFREYDIRGIFDKELTEQSVKKLGFFLGEEVRHKIGADCGDEVFVAVGYDARTHSPVLFDWLCFGFISAGCSILGMGLVPTGVNYFVGFNELEFDGKKLTPDATVQITGSHNPPEYNGFKITINQEPFFGADIQALGKRILADGGNVANYKQKDGVKIHTIDAKTLYIDYLVEQFKVLENFPKKIVMDCGNGAAGVVAPFIVARLGISTKFLFVEPDGTFPNHHPDPSDEDNLVDLKKELASGEFDIGLAFDGDADRIAVLTPKYNIKGDQLSLIFARQMAKEGIRPTVIGEVKCSKVMYDEINKIGSAIMYKTGHSNLKVKLKESGAHFAAEVSGHMFFNDKWFGFDDAIYVAFRVLELVAKGVDLDSEMDQMPKMFSTDELKVKVTEETKFGIIEKIRGMLTTPPSYLPEIYHIENIDGVRVSFGHGWGLIRASNTTPMLVTRFEADSALELEKIQEAMNRLIAEAQR